MERLALVESAFGEGSFGKVRAQHPRSRVADDDILDAMAATWSALRIQRGEAKSIPTSPGVDGEALSMAMWY